MGKNWNKNKSKGTSAVKPPKPKVPSNWYYMSDQEVSVVDMKAVLEKLDYEMEVWEEAGVMEILLEEKSSMDLEWIEDDFEDEYSRNFLEEHGVKTLFYVTIKPESYELAKAVMEQICEKAGGFFCGDTEEFTPVVGGNKL